MTRRSCSRPGSYNHVPSLTDCPQRPALRSGPLFCCMLSMSSSQRSESLRPSLTEAKGSEAQGCRREAASESSVEQSCGPMNKNRLRGAKGGRAGNWPQSPSRSKPGSVESAVVQRRQDDLSQEICAVTRREPRLGAWRHAPSFAQKSAKGVVAVKAGKAGWSEGPNGASEWTQASRGQVNRTLP
jgi:hypothetical protein